jgi:hypothetical protein
MRNGFPERAMRNGFPERPSWLGATESLRRAVDEVCGSPATGARDVHGGMTPGPAAVLDLADGRQVFVKAVPEAATGSCRLYQREAVALRALPAGAPAPALIGHATAGGWFALVMTAVAGEIAGPPWTDRGARLVAAACAVSGSLRAPGAVPPVADLLVDLDGWERLPDGQLDEWDREHAATMARRASGWREWTAGPFLVHQDVRADNALIGNGTATLVDWSFCCAGASWLDRARLAADIVAAGHSGGAGAAVRAAREILRTLPAPAPGWVIALAGMWRYRSTLPPPAGLPALRAWQAARARALRPLLEELSEI